MIVNEVFGNLDNAEFSMYIHRIQIRFDNRFRKPTPLFKASVNVWPIFLQSIPVKDRQYHNCNCCKQFFEKYGSIVTIDDRGWHHSAIWNEADAPLYYRKAVNAMLTALNQSSVTSVFYSNECNWGTHRTDYWNHFAVKMPLAMICQNDNQTIQQTIAEKTEDFKMLRRALNRFSLKTATLALTIIESGQLYRSDMVLKHAQWFHELKTHEKDVKFENQIWNAVATAAPGACHVNSTMLGTVLEDVLAKKPFKQIKDAFARKMKPTEYMRPTKISSGNIDQAEKKFQQLGLAPALERRFARIDECELLWKPQTVKSGIFSRIRTSQSFDMTGPSQATVMTWEKFQQKVLPAALEIELMIPRSGSFAALVTRVRDDDPPILRWDSMKRRNSVSLYMYSQGSPATQWGFSSSSIFIRVTGITLRPNNWHDSYPPNGVVFLLQGAMDSMDSGLGLFPEILKSELHAYRSTIERFSNTGKVQGREQGSACGLCLNEQNLPGSWKQLLRVHSKNTIIDYVLDRWE
jgi:hypothetical protein